jgi:uncharacterized membrane protein
VSRTSPRSADLAVPAEVDPRPGPAQRTVAVVLLIAGLIGFAAAFVLAVEKFLLLTDPAYNPTCTINATVSCVAVMSSPQSAVFGFPNPLLGIGGFAVVATVGAVWLAGARLAGWFRVGLQAGVVAGVVFVGWLIAQSLFVIEGLCPYCMVVWAVTLTAFWYLTLDNLELVRDRLPTSARNVLDFARRNHVALAALGLLSVAALVVSAALGF